MMDPSYSLVVAGDNPFNTAWETIKLWARGRNAGCETSSGLEMIGGRGNVTVPDFVHGLTTGFESDTIHT